MYICTQIGHMCPSRCFNMKIFSLLIFSFYFCLFSSQAQGLKVLFMGDSITDGGWGNSGGKAKSSEERNHRDMNHIYGHSYMFLCASHYESLYPERLYHFQNRGVSGYTLSDLEERWEKDVLSFVPDVLSVLVGTNDIHIFVAQDSILERFDIGEWERRYRALLDRALLINPQMRLVLATPFTGCVGKMKESATYPLRAILTEQCAAVVKRIADDYKCICLDYKDMFDALLQGEPKYQETYWIWDGIHPTPAGHRRMSDLWIREVEKRGWM